MEEKISFYEALRNAHPIAVIASVSMVIAAFSFRNDDLAGMSNNAMIAAAMFLISFTASLLDQLVPTKNNEKVEMIHWGRLFFFGIGVLYLILIVWEFGKFIPQIGNIVIGWIIIAIGLSSLSTIFSKKGIYNKKRIENTKIFKIMNVLGIIYSSAFIGGGLSYVFNNELSKIIPVEETYGITGYITGIGFIILFISVIIIVFYEKNRKKDKK